jgi:hypothetical protein
MHTQVLSIGRGAIGKGQSIGGAARKGATFDLLVKSVGVPEQKGEQEEVRGGTYSRDRRLYYIILYYCT